MSETVKKENDMTETVKFNVGGSIYEVSRSLLERYPDTMLAKSASKRWQEVSMSEIFIERDGDLFRHVLSYLRDGRVVLPLTASREGLMLEFQYYGLDGVEKENIDDSLIRGSQHAGIYKKVLQNFKRKVEENGEEKRTLKRKTQQNDNEAKVLQFSSECILKWSTNHISTDSDGSKHSWIEYPPGYSRLINLRSDTFIFVSRCNKHLESFGLFLTNNEDSLSSLSIREKPSDK